MTMTPAAFANLRGPQLRAAQAALEKVTARRGEPAGEDVQAWVHSLWAGGVGPVDAATAARALEAFSDRAPPPQAPVLGKAVLKPGAGGVTLRAAQLDDGSDWKASIDLRNVEPRLVAMEADLEWVLSLDLRDPEQYRQIGQWLGWTIPDGNYDKGATWESDTIRGWVLGALSQRHGIPCSISEPALEASLTDDGSQRWQALRNFKETARDFARGVFERDAKLDAFLSNADTIRDRIRGDRANADEVRHELEDRLGIPRDTIRPGELKHYLDEMGDRDRGLTDEQHLRRRKGMGHLIHFVVGSIRGEATKERIADTLIALGLHEKVTTGAVSDDVALATLAESFGVPVEGISPSAYDDAKKLAPMYLNAYG